MRTQVTRCRRQARGQILAKLTYPRLPAPLLVLVGLFVVGGAIGWNASLDRAWAGDGVLCTLIGNDFCRRNCWPQPYLCEDIAAARAPWAAQVANGWERQNLLAEPYFDPATKQLNEAGRRKIQWILLDAPEGRRIIFVRRGLTTEETQSRLHAVRTYLAGLGPGAPSADVLVSNMPADGASGARVDWVNRKFITVLPEPRLPEVKEPGDSGK